MGFLLFMVMANGIFAASTIRVSRDFIKTRKSACLAGTQAAYPSRFTPADLPVLLRFYEVVHQRPWICLIAENWLNHSPFDEPWETGDFNADGVTDLADFALAANCGYPGLSVSDFQPLAENWIRETDGNDE